MSRKREAQQAVEEEASKRIKLEKENWEVKVPKKTALMRGRFQKDTSSTESTLPGRRSFRGFNTVVEKYYAQYIGKPVPESPKNSSSVDLSEEDMAKHYDSLVSLPRGPNQVPTLPSESLEKLLTVLFSLSFIVGSRSNPPQYWAKK